MVEVGLPNPRASATYILPSVSLTREASRHVDQQKPLHPVRTCTNSVYGRGRMAPWEGILLLCRVMKQSTNEKSRVRAQHSVPVAMLLSREASRHETMRYRPARAIQVLTNVKVWRYQWFGQVADPRTHRASKVAGIKPVSRSPVEMAPRGSSEELSIDVMLRYDVVHTQALVAGIREPADRERRDATQRSR
jgi:hypothetical protein